MDSEGPCQGWENLPPELLRRVYQQLLSDWHYATPARPIDSLLPVRATCRSWCAVVDADVRHVAPTVPPLAPDYLALHFQNISSLDLSRYQRGCQEVFPVMQQLQLRRLVLADPWDPPLSIPAECLTQLSYLSFMAEGLLVPRIAAEFCHALRQLSQLQELHLSRLQLSAQAAQQLGQVLKELPNLQTLALSGGASAVSAAELYMLLNVDLSALRSLEMTRLGVRLLPLSLTKLVGLTRLTFGGEMLRNVQLRDEVRHLTNLEVLDISANLAEQLPSGVLELTRLRELYAGMNRLGVHMHTFSRLEQLEVLVLASNKLLAVHPSLWGLTTLERLDLGHNSLSELPADISRLTGLTFLSVCHNFLTALPSSISCLVDLVELDVSLNTDMRELPAGLGQLSKLTRLVACHMRLKQLPIDVGGLVSLVHLDVAHNSLHHLSPQLSCLLGLTHLEASDNKLHQSAAVPEELASLTALRVLRLARNRLQSLPEALGCYGSLRVLDCSGNRLTSVPRVLGKCTALQQLLMASNRLRGLTSGIGNLVRLQVLDLSHNQYRHLPTMTGDLTQLQELLLEDNQLEDLPSSCSALVKLSNLTLSSNRLHVLPPPISRMSGLLMLTLLENPLLDKDAVILQLQRQLPLLQIDGLSPLGVNKAVTGASDVAFQLRSNWPTADVAVGAAPVPLAAIAGAAAGPSSAAAVTVPAWLNERDVSRGLAQLIQHAVEQAQEQPAAQFLQQQHRQQQQQQQHGLLSAFLGWRDKLTGSTPNTQLPPAAGDGASASTNTAVVNQAVSAEAHVNSAVWNAGFTAGKPMLGGPWQQTMFMQQQFDQSLLQAASGAVPGIAEAAVTDGSSSGDSKQQGSLVQQLAQRLQRSGLRNESLVAQREVIARSTSSGTVAGFEVVAAGGRDSVEPPGGAGSSASAQCSDVPRNSCSEAGSSVSHSYAAKVKSYLEVATTAPGSTRDKQSASHQQQQLQSSGSLLRTRSCDSNAVSQLHADRTIQHPAVSFKQPAAVQYSRDGIAASSPSAATEQPASSVAAARAGSSAAAGLHEQYSNMLSAGGASTSDRDNDDACSAAGVDSCGSDDSSSDVMVRLGHPHHSDAEGLPGGASAGHDLRQSPCDYLQHSEPDLTGQVSVTDMSRCPSSSSGMLGAGSGGGALAAGGHAAVCDASAPGASSCSEKVAEGSGGLSSVHQQAYTQHVPDPPAAASSCAASAYDNDQQSQQQADSSKLSSVLDSSWWGRRKK